MDKDLTHQIVVGVDGSGAAERALAWAKSFADVSGGDISAVSAWRYPVAAMPGTWAPAPAPEMMQDATSSMLDGSVDRVLGEGEGRRVVRQGSSSMVLLDEAKDAELLVVGRSGAGGWLGTGLGSTARQCAHHAETPLVIVGDEAEPLPAEPKVLVAVDGSDHSVNALVWALQSFGGHQPVTAVHSHDEWILDDILDEDELARRLQDQATDRLADAVDIARGRSGTEGAVATVSYLEVCIVGAPLAAHAVAGRIEPAHRVDLRVVRGDPRTTVWDVAREMEADVVVVGARGKTGIVGAVIGSFTSHAVHHCPPTMSLAVIP